MRKYLVGAVGLLSLLLFSPHETLGKCRIDYDGFGYEVQKWYALDCDDPIKQITGTISGIRLNDQDGGILCPGPDGDWNIFVKPDQSWILKNSDNQQNAYTNDLPCGITIETWDASPMRRIELEVKSSTPSEGQNLKDYFGHGDRVTARGYWVEDSGHNSKTELHPLVSIVGGTNEKFAIFVAQDVSDRFVTEDWAINEYFDFDLSSEGSGWMLRPSGPTTHKLPNSSVLLEQFKLDYLPTSLFCQPSLAPLNERIRSQARTIFNPFGFVSLHTYVPPDSNCVKPYYLSSFRRGEASSLSEIITVTVVSGSFTDRSGNARAGKKLDIKIKAQLDAPPANLDSLSPPADPAGLAESKWRYEELNSATRNVETRYVTQTTGHSIETDLVYWPAGGYSDSSWTLSVAGSTRGENWSPWSTPTAGLNGPFTRGHVHDRRAYTIVPSALAVQRQPITGQVTSSPTGGPTIQKTCVVGYTVSVDKAGLIAGVDMSQPKWLVHVGQDANGNAVNQIVTVPPGPAVNAGGATVRNNGNSMEIRFNDMGWDVYNLAMGILTPSLISKNNTVLRVSTVGMTEIGESIGATTDELLEPLCLGTKVTAPASIVELMREGQKVMAALIWLKERGLLPPKPWPPDPLPLDQIKKGNPQGLPSTANIDEVARQLPPQYQQLAATLLKVKTGRVFTKADLTLLDAVLKVSHELPDLRPLARPALLSRPRLQKSMSPRMDTVSANLPTTRIPPRIEKDGAFVLQNVAFDRNSSTVQSGALLDLHRLLRRLLLQKEAKINVTVDIGRSVPEKLALERADAIRQFLVRNGVDANRVTTSVGKQRTGELPTSKGSVHIRAR